MEEIVKLAAALADACKPLDQCYQNNLAKQKEATEAGSLYNQEPFSLSAAHGINMIARREALLAAIKKAEKPPEEPKK